MRDTLEQRRIGLGGNSQRRRNPAIAATRNMIDTEP